MGAITCFILIPFTLLIIIMGCASISDPKDWTCLYLVVFWLYASIFLALTAVVFTGVTFFMFYKFRQRARDPYMNPTSIYPRIQDSLSSGNDEPLYINKPV
jgi:heme/copper-type cytochrome/quinol oxidase subunit 2